MNAQDASLVGRVQSDAISSLLLKQIETSEQRRIPTEAVSCVRDRRAQEESLVNPHKVQLLVGGLIFCIFSVLATTSYAGNDVLGESELVGATKVEKTSGVWIDGQYVGYLKELKRSKKILLLPGEHEIVVRQGGYKDFSQKVIVQPGGKQVIRVAMEKDLRMQIPTITALRCPG